MPKKMIQQENSVPRERVICPACSNGIAGGSAYFDFGAVIDLLFLKKRKLSDSIMEGFCHIGYHGVRSDMMDSVDYCVADAIIGGQLEIYFCSLGCLRKWLCDIVDNLEGELKRKMEEKGALDITDTQEQGHHQS